MGFSTSGSLLVIFFALLIALGTLYAAASTAGGALSDGVSEQSERLDTIYDTDVALLEATWNETDETLTVTTQNTGTTTVPVAETTMLVDGEYESLDSFDEIAVDGEASSLWQPNANLTVSGTTDEPERVKLVTDIGISVTGPVEVTA